MAARRTVTIYTADSKDKRSPVTLFLKILEAIGKPIFWFIVILASILTLKPRKVQKHQGNKLLLRVIIFFFLYFTGMILSLNLILLKDLPNPDRLTSREQILTTKIYDRNGKLLYKMYRNQNRTLVPLSEIPITLIQATIATEDSEFYKHSGFSPKGILRAIWQDIRGGKLYGGSTITQQLVKNTLLTPERTFQRKFKEVVLALMVERKFSKDEILQMYLNEVGFGGTAYGVEEASQTYFGKPVRDLNLAESAMLAGLPASPTSYSPFGAYPERAKSRQVYVLKRMAQENFITNDEAEKAAVEEVRLVEERTDIKAPHFVMYVKDLLVQKYGLNMIEEGGLEVTTSLDLDIQEATQKIVAEEIDKIERFHITNGAVIVTNPKSGEILAMVGSRDYFDKEHDGNVNVTLSLRQPGSSIKPVNYSIALENGFTAASVLSDTPITYRLPGQPDYVPRNYDNRFHGNVPLRVALGSSYNIPAVKILSAFGVDRMVERGKDLGITTWEDPTRFGLSLTLGGGEVKMTDMAVVFGTFANLGDKVTLQPLLRVQDYKKESIYQSTVEPKKVINPSTAFILTNILADNSARVPAFGSNSVLNIANHPHIAVKTGTTQNMRDNWTIGYTPDFLVAVWVGNNDNTPMSYVASGVTGASPIWNKVMTTLVKDIPDKELPVPENINQVEICSLTGTLSCEGCPTRKEIFTSGTEPKNHCNPETIRSIMAKDSQNAKPLQ